MAYFEEYDIPNKLFLIKREFQSIVAGIFSNPSILKAYVLEKKISDDQSKLIFELVSKLNLRTCVCCKELDKSKLIPPLDKDLEILIELTQKSVKGKYF